MRLRSIALLPLCVVVACGHHAADDTEIAPTAATAMTVQPAVTKPAPVRAQRNGRGFPDGVLALTWDDGPDVHTLELAEYLRREHVSATFFTVHDWAAGVSSDPGFGARVTDTGYGKVPLLSDLVALGHRIGNHTMHHVLLGRAAPDVATRELEDAQRDIDPFIRDEIRFFRAPGGDWSASTSHAIDGDPYLANLVGPIRWDVDAKDWEGSVWCESSPRRECEHEDGRFRVRADVMAERYEHAITSAGRGIVLLHDRVGDVGSRYALDVAERLVPWLVARGYVFAAPVLGFGSMQSRWASACRELRLGDVDGDGRADACMREGERVLCAMSSSHEERSLERMSFDEKSPIAVTLPPAATSFELADVTGDARADLCARTSAGIACAVAVPSGGFGAFELWSASRDVGGEWLADFSDGQGWGSDTSYERTIRFADVDGDGRADVCGRTPAGFGLVCARSTGSGFEPARLWLGATADASAWASPEFAPAIALGDLDGDGRADICARAPSGVFCALSKRTAFGPLSRWSADKLEGPLTLGDLNGDSRADICAGAWCALSNGHAFTKAVAWLDDSPTLRAQWGAASLGDVNGDGRSDRCICDAQGVRCALAP